MIVTSTIMVHKENCMAIASAYLINICLVEVQSLICPHSGVWFSYICPSIRIRGVDKEPLLSPTVSASPCIY